MSNNMFKMARSLQGLRQILKGSHRTIKYYGLGSSWTFEREYSSALHTSGRKSNKEFSYFTPYLDFDGTFGDMEKLQQNVSIRNMGIHNIHELKKVWDYYKNLCKLRRDLESRTSELANEISKLNRTAELEKTKTLIEKIKTDLKLAKQDLQQTKNVIWDLDETVIEKLLRLPNKIDKRTPLQSPVVLKQFGTLNDTLQSSMKSHIEIGQNLGLLEYKNPMQYYLCNDAVLFELGVLSLAGKILKENDMIRVSGTDFSRSSVVEGSGLNHENPLDAFVISNYNESQATFVNRMHLVGTASLVSFLAMHTKQLINPNHFPLKYFATGRQYTPFSETSTPLGLFTICQSSVVHAFVTVTNENSEEHNNQFEKLLSIVSKLYENVCDHYQIVMRPASELRPWETLRVSFELWSPFAKQYIEVGHVSVYGDYLSKRLRIAYQTPTGRDFPAIMSGTVLSVPRLLGCLLEQNAEKFVVPPEILKHMPVDTIDA